MEDGRGDVGVKGLLAGTRLGGLSITTFFTGDSDAAAPSSFKDLGRF